MTGTPSSHPPTRSRAHRRVTMAALSVALVVVAVVGSGALPAGATTVTAAANVNVVVTGEAATVKGTTAPMNAASPVAVQRRLPSGTWSTRAVGRTDQAGRFSIPIAPTGQGIYALRVRAAGSYSPVFYLRVLGPLVLDQGGLGPLRLGMTVAQAKATHWVVGTTQGCEVSGETAAVFPAGVKVSAAFLDGKLLWISLDRTGRTAEGARIGDTEASLSVTYPPPAWNVDLDTSSLQMFGVDLLAVSYHGNPRYGITADPHTKKIKAIAVPYTSICE